MIPVQAVIGGISVLTDLNPWVVALHLLGVDGQHRDHRRAAVAAARRRRARRRCAARGGAARPAHAVVVTALVLAAGTVVTGAGPHSGAKHRASASRIKPSSVTQLHADLVMVLIGLTVGLIALLYAVRAEPGRCGGPRWSCSASNCCRASSATSSTSPGCRPVLVGVHMFGACLVWIAARLRRARRRAAGRSAAPDQSSWRDAVDQHADDRADDRAVQPDELQVASDLKL